MGRRKPTETAEPRARRSQTLSTFRKHPMALTALAFAGITAASDVVSDANAKLSSQAYIEAKKETAEHRDSIKGVLGQLHLKRMKDLGPKADIQNLEFEPTETLEINGQTIHFGEHPELGWLAAIDGVDITFFSYPPQIVRSNVKAVLEYSGLAMR